MTVLLDFHGQAGPLVSALLLPSPEQPYYSIGWTLVLEVVFYGCAAIALMAPRRLRLWMCLAWVSLIVVFSNHPIRHDIGLVFVLANPLCCTFLLGVAINRWENQLVVANRVAAAVLGLSAAVLMMAGAGLFNLKLINPYLGDEWSRVLLVGAPAALVLLSALSLSKIARPTRQTRLSQLVLLGGIGLGNRSYALYLAHYPVVSAVGLLIAPTMSGMGGAALHVFLASLGVALATEVLHRWVERPCVGVSQRLRHNVRQNGTGCQLPQPEGGQKLPT